MRWARATASSIAGLAARAEDEHERHDTAAAAATRPPPSPSSRRRRAGARRAVCSATTRVQAVGRGDALGGLADAASDVLGVVDHWVLACVLSAPSASRVRARCSRVVTVDSFAPTAFAASA